MRIPILLVFSSILASLSACGGSDGGGPPTGPGEPDPSPSDQVDSVAVTPSQAPVEEGRTLQLSAQAFDDAGQELSGVEVSWSSDNTFIATVDGSGLVAGQSQGHTLITASADGASGGAAVRVRTGETAVIDSTVLDLVSDSSERAAGVFRFEVRGGPPFNFEAGDIIVGAEQGGFLRRVTEVTAQNASDVEVQTEQAALAEAVESGSFQTTIEVGPGTPSSTIRQGNITVGPTRAIGFSPSITVDGGALLLNDHELAGGEECIESDGSTTCASVSLTLTDGRIAFQPDMDIGVNVGFFSIEEFHAIGEGNLTFDLSAELISSATSEFGDERRLDQGFFRTPFTVLVGGVPVTGEVRLAFYLGYEVRMDAEGSLGSGFQSDFTTRLGARYEDDAWSEVFETSSSYDPEPVVVGLGGGATARVWVKPQVTVFFYSTAGPNTFLEPYLQGNAVFAEECTFDLESGLDAGLGFDVEILSFEVASFSQTFSVASETLANESIDCTANEPPTATIALPADGSSHTDGQVVTFEGSASDPDGSIASVAWTSDVDGELGTSLSFARSDLSVGTHTITLEAVDGDGAAATDQVSLTVEGADPSNESPSASISSPADNSTHTEGETVTFEGSASDPDGSIASVAWRSDIDGELGSSLSFTRSDLSVGTHTITLEAVDGDGAAATDQVSLTVEGADPSNEPPSASISVPTDGSSYTEGETVSFEGSASDPDGSIASVTWRSDLDGELGNSLSFTRSDLSVGTHTVTLEAVDGDGASATDQISLSIESSSQGTSWVKITAGGGGHSCGIISTGEAYCWGGNLRGGLGDGTESDTDRPVLVGGGNMWSRLNGGTLYTCGITTGTDAYCWGSNRDGQLGNGSTSDNPKPVRVEGGYSWQQVAAGDSHTCGVNGSSDAYCWGHNEHGELGDTTMEEHLTPILVTGGHSWQLVDPGAHHSCGLTTNGDVYCWGSNSFGRLGSGSSSDSNIPVLVAGGHEWSQVSTGQIHTCGVAVNGNAYCWGRNDEGQLGIGSTSDDTNTPVLVAGGHDWRQVAVGRDHTCGLTRAGDAYCWGRNSNGQLGDGSMAGSTTPVLVAGGHDWSQVVAAHAHNCGRTDNERIYCWGRNANGELGNGAMIDSSTPVRVSDPVD